MWPFVSNEDLNRARRDLERDMEKVRQGQFWVNATQINDLLKRFALLEGEVEGLKNTLKQYNLSPKVPKRKKWKKPLRR